MDSRPRPAGCCSGRRVACKCAPCSRHGCHYSRRAQRWIGKAAALLLALGVAFAATSARADLIVTTSADSGPGSLRDAITQANSSSADQTSIICNIPCPPGGGPPVITLQTPLPTVIGGGIRIFGLNPPCGPVCIDGSLLPDGSHALRFVASSTNREATSLLGFKIQNVPGEAVVDDTDNQNDLGLKVSFCEITKNQVGVFLNGVRGAVIGQVTPGTAVSDFPPPAGPANGGNLISGNSFAQIQITGGGAHVIQGNFIGTNAAGTAADPASNQGITITDSDKNTVGGLLPGQGNLISGNNSSVASDGVIIFSPGGTVGGNTVAGNYIGVDLTGAAAIPNPTGVAVIASPNNIIQHNVISGNTGFGVTIQGVPATGNRVIGNFIGTDVTGLARLGNGNINVEVIVAPGNIIGGATPGFGNIIADAKGGNPGIQVNTGDNTTIQGNSIGTDSTGLLNFGNSAEGIQILESSNMTIGGTSPGAGNLIGFNAKTGISLVPFSGQALPVNNAFLGNSIFSNQSFFGGIDLAGDGPTANDNGDADDGPNHLQNFPVIDTAVTANGVTTISGTLNSTASTVFAVEMFASVVSTNFNREGQFFLGRMPVTTDAAGDAPFSLSASMPAPVPAGFFITATATDPQGNTSEFASPVAVTGDAAAQDVAMTSTVTSDRKALSFRAEKSGPAAAAALTTSSGTPGATLTYTFTLRNLSASDSGPLAFSDSLPAGLTFASVTSSAGTTGNSGNTVTASFSSLAGNVSATITITATIDGSVAAGTFLTNRASLTTNQPDPNPLNNATALAIQVLPPSAQLQNISTRLRVLTGDNVLIGGFIITGADPKKVLVRGIGPSLANAGIADALADPALELRDSSGTLIAANDNWQDAPNKQEIIDSTVAPGNDLESAILQTLPANNAGYTAILSGKGGGTGIGLVEAFDLTQAANSKLANISTRGFVQTGNNVMIGGLILGPTANGSSKVIVRAIGPSLAAAAVTNPLQDPTLELRDVNGALIVSNDNWQDDPAAAEIQSDQLAPSDPRESATLQTLAPGNYTAIVGGVGDTIGVGLVEVFNLQ